MGIKKVIFLALLAACFITESAQAASRRNVLRDEYDIIVAGGGCGGTAAAIQAARLGASVLIIEESSWLGGQATAAGVSTMDDLSRIKSGIYLELYSRIQDIYGSIGKSTGTCYWSPKSVAFEPHVGQQVLLELINSARNRGRNTLDILMNSSVTSVQHDNKTVQGVTIRTPNGVTKVACKVLIDATEYGDILPLAGAEYRVGNSKSPFINSESRIQDITWVAVIKRYSGGIPANLKPLSPLPGYDLAKRNYESYVTPDGMDFKGVYPVNLPINFISHNAYRGLPDSSNPWFYDGTKESWKYISKSCVNWGNDYPGTYGWNGRRGLPVTYLEDSITRLNFEREALLKTLHFIYYMQNELNENWSVADDEYYNKELPVVARNLPLEWQEIVRRMPPIPYIRESRRIVGDYTLTSAEMLYNSLNCRDGQTNHEFPDAIAIGGYILDLHGADTDSDMEWEFEERAASSGLNRPRGPFQVPMRTLIPRGIEGLLATEKNISATRLAAGALRLQPISMMTGQAAGALAALAVQTGTRLRDVPSVRVQWELLNAGVILSLTNYSDVPLEHPSNKSVQIANLYGLVTPDEFPHAPSYNISDLDDPVLAMAVIKGHDKGVFGTEQFISQQEMMEMINKGRVALGFDEISLNDISSKSGNFITRGTFARALAAAFKFPEISNNSTGSRNARAHATFQKSDNPAYPAVAELAPHGVFDVYKGDSTFRFGRPVTRIEAVDMLVRAMVSCQV